MAIFGGEKLSREEKQKQKIQKYLSQRGIDNLNEKSNV